MHYFRFVCSLINRSFFSSPHRDLRVSKDSLVLMERKELGYVTPYSSTPSCEINTDVRAGDVFLSPLLI